MEKKLSAWRLKQAEMRERLKSSEKLVFATGKRHVLKGLYTKGTSYVKKIHGPLDTRSNHGDHSQKVNR